MGWRSGPSSWADLLQARAEQELRREILPLEQAPEIVESASRVLQGTHLSIFGGEAQLLGQLAPVFEILAASSSGQLPQRP
jgi:hypothetical protein